MRLNQQDYQPVGDIIKNTRLADDLSQDALAERLRKLDGRSAITREEVSRWERGKRIPGPRWRTQLGSVLHIDPVILARGARATRRNRGYQTVINLKNVEQRCNALSRLRLDPQDIDAGRARWK